MSLMNGCDDSREVIGVVELDRYIVYLMKMVYILMLNVIYSSFRLFLVYLMDTVEQKLQSLRQRIWAGIL